MSDGCCPRCGAPSRAGASFCARCGTQLLAALEETGPPSLDAVPSGGPPARSEVSRARSLLLPAAVVLGLLGVGGLGWLFTRSDTNPGPSTGATAVSPPMPSTSIESSAATRSPSPEPSGSPVVLGTPCRSGAYGFEVAYPQGWFASEGGPELECRFFHPTPFEVAEATELFGIAVAVLPEQGPYESLRATWADPEFVSLVGQRDTVVDGRPATIFETVATGAGSDPAGTRTYACLVNVDGDGFVLLTSGFTGREYEEYRAVVSAMAASLRFAP